MFSPTSSLRSLWPWLVLAVLAHLALYLLPTTGLVVPPTETGKPMRLRLKAPEPQPAPMATAEPVLADVVEAETAPAPVAATPEPQRIEHAPAASPAPQPTVVAVESEPLRVEPPAFGRARAQANEVLDSAHRPAATPGLSSRWVPQSDLPAPARPDFHQPERPGLVYAPLPELPGAPSSFSKRWLIRDDMTALDVQAAQRPWLGFVLSLLNYGAYPPAGSVTQACIWHHGEQACEDPEWMKVEADIGAVSDALSPLNRWRD